MNSAVKVNQWPWNYLALEGYSWNKKSLPKISIIIPSYNQGQFIEETLLSILGQKYPALELIVIDGGSKDNTVDIIKKYENQISYWVSEPDRGQSHAINKGLKIASGEWIAWINSDDCYLEGCFHYLFAENNFNDYDFLYGNYQVGENLNAVKEVHVMSSEIINLRKVLCFFYGAQYIIPSQSVFVKRDFVEKVGWLNEELHYCMDLEWYARFFQNGVKPYKYSKTLCFFRYNTSTKTSVMAKERIEDNKMVAEAESIAVKYLSELSFAERWKLKRMFHYYNMYSRDIDRHANSKLIDLLKIVCIHPLQSFSDRRLLGLIKRKLFN